MLSNEVAKTTRQVFWLRRWQIKMLSAELQPNRFREPIGTNRQDDLDPSPEMVRLVLT